MIWPIFPSAAAKPNRSFPSGGSGRMCIAPCSSVEWPDMAARSECAGGGNR
jgi:hypothetical protein